MYSLIEPTIRNLLDGGEATQVTVLFRSVPSGATVTFNDEPLDGKTPLAVEIALTPKSYKASFALGNENVSTKLKVNAGQTFATVDGTLLEYGEVKVITEPPGAKISIDGNGEGASPLTLKKVMYDDEHELVASLDGYDDEKLTLTSARPEKHQIRLVLQKKGKKRNVTLMSNPVADIRIDGRPGGRTGDEPIELPVGTHDLSLTVAGLGIEADYTIRVVDGAANKYYFDLTAGAK